MTVVRVTAVAFVAVLGLPSARVAAQTAPVAGLGHSCNSCHAPHPSSGAAANLRIGASAAIAAYSLPGLRDASTSCLRCHGTPEIREREASLEWGQLRVLEGRFLGLDLSDDHPLGRVKANVVDRLTLLRPLLEAERAAAGRSESPVVDCASCHDPHDRVEAGWNPADDERCATCHDDRRYELASHSTLSCANCHKMHGGSVPTLLAEQGGDALCITCHVTPGRAGGNLELGRRFSASLGHVVSSLERCASCHPPHGTG